MNRPNNAFRLAANANYNDLYSSILDHDGDIYLYV